MVKLSVTHSVEPFSRRSGQFPNSNDDGVGFRLTLSTL